MLYYQLFLFDIFFTSTLQWMHRNNTVLQACCIIYKKKVCVNILHLLGNLDICSTSVSLCLSFRNP